MSSQSFELGLMTFKFILFFFVSFYGHRVAALFHAVTSMHTLNDSRYTLSTFHAALEAYTPSFVPILVVQL